MPQHHKIEEELSTDELEELRRWIREKNGTRTTDEVLEWCQAKGFTGGRTAVGNWLQKFREELIAERMKAGGGLAKAMLDAAEQSGSLAVAKAANLKLSQLVFEKASAGELEISEVTEMALGMQRLGLAMKRVGEEERRFTHAMQGLVGKREITQQDIDDVRKKTFG